MSTLVVGIGNRERGDDGVGPAVAERAIRGVDVLVEREPLGLLEHFATYDEVVVVDAVSSGDDPRGVRTWLVGPGPLPHEARPIGSHSLGIGDRLDEAVRHVVDCCPRVM